MKYVIALGLVVVFCLYGLLHIARKRRKRIADNQDKLPPLPFLLRKYPVGDRTGKVNTEPIIDIHPITRSKAE